MFIELHILQNFAPSNLNRDETGTPKSCLFGDVPRSRVSSQALKRAARDYVKKHELLSPEILGNRTKCVEEQLQKILASDEFKKNETEAKHVANYVLKAAGWKKEKEKEESDALQFLGLQTLNQVAKFCDENWISFQGFIKLQIEKENLSSEKKALDSEIKKLDKDLLKNSTPELKTQLDEKKKRLGEIEKQLKSADVGLEEVKKQLPKGGEIKAILGKKQTPDIALFGRMMADVPEHNIDAASQVAHAISTHIVNNAEFDYFTALDDLEKEFRPNSNTAVKMIGSIDFNSACYYRYANIDVNQLTDNLKNAENPKELAKKTIKAFLTSFVIAVPSGKQNSFASPTLPTFVLGVIREGYLCSLANAFSTPVKLRDDDEIGLVEKSIFQMTKHFDNLERMYGKTVGTKSAFYFTESNENIYQPETEVERVKAIEKDSLEDLINAMITEVKE